MFQMLDETASLHLKTDTLLDAAAVCAQGLRHVGISRRFNIILTIALALLNIVLIAVACDGLLAPGVVFLVMILFMLAVTVMFYCLWLVLVWNTMERKSIVATQKGIECILEELRKKNAEQFQKTSLANSKSNGK